MTHQVSSGFKAGDIVMRSQPWIYCLHPMLFDKYCYGCLKSLFANNDYDLESNQNHILEIIKCYGCGLVQYCSKECQSDDRKARHEQECVLMKAMCATGAQPQADVLLILKAIFAVKKGRLNMTEGECQPLTGRSYRDLISHKDEILSDPQLMNNIRLLMEKLKKLLPGEELIEFDKLVEIYGKIKMNAYDIKDAYLRHIAEGVYFGPAMFNHDCKNNAVYRFVGKEIFIQAIQDIPDLNQVCLSYINVFTFSELRQNELKDWYFRCTCDLCADPDTEAELKAILCSTEDCDAPRPLDIGQLACASCVGSELNGNSAENSQHPVNLAKTAIEVDLQHHEIINELREKYLNSVTKPTPDGLLAGLLEEIEFRCRLILDRSGPLYHPQNFVLGSTLDILGRVLLMQRNKENHSQALGYIRGTLPAMRKMHNPHHPRLGLQILVVSLLELEQLMNKPSCDPSALEHAKEALGIFAVCNGTDQPLYKTASRVAETAGILLNGNMEELKDSACVKNAYRLIDRMLPILTDIFYTTICPRPFLDRV